jgi:hypothetical protein
MKQNVALEDEKLKTQINRKFNDINNAEENKKKRISL